MSSRGASVNGRTDNGASHAANAAAAAAVPDAMYAVSRGRGCRTGRYGGKPETVLEKEGASSRGRAELRQSPAAFAAPAAR
eukprot:82174-Chlamydomonas_euryale.AAC.2